MSRLNPIQQSRHDRALTSFKTKLAQYRAETKIDERQWHKGYSYRHHEADRLARRETIKQLGRQ